MPLTKLASDAFGVVTICLVALLILLGLLCIAYSFYFQSHVHNRDYVQLGYFSGPWIIRIAFILFAIWWAFGEIFRLSLLRRDGRPLNSLDLQWQENTCKWYIVSNLGFAEPCLFLTLVFLLRAPLKMETGTLTGKWNAKTAGYVILYCLPVFALQLVVIITGSRIHRDGSGYLRKLPNYFTRTYSRVITDQDRITLCTYPLLSTILLGVFATVLTAYLFCFGRQILKLVINKRLQKRVYTLIFSVSSFFPLRIVLLSLSVLTNPEDILFEALAFLAFLSLLSFAAVSIFLLVYFPVSDSMALRGLRDLEEPMSGHEERSGALLLGPETSNTEGSVGIREWPRPSYVELVQFLESEK
ncbi:PREDICTED: uncharacterized protein LOC104816831 [Tarenaya hassleriana]|uniref:uncharacterized protein LOC104816831 n=1 Tax=Tarenaya hassleriana TaxID=28532 RepID=UPI00053CA2F2|nr:PREDICTED: uncharacterized protein LOC104816831 [Tarenaya hassleriana]XP_019058462.1 PREDICTED: uncharacterized protein LOC104816831 [Tarenaya hassleriana]